MTQITVLYTEIAVSKAESIKPVSPSLPSHTEPAPNPALLVLHLAQPEPPEGPC